MKQLAAFLFALLFGFCSFAQLPKVYDETINPIEQLDSAIARAKAENKEVLAQVGGNWCPWCLRLADFISKDAEIKALVDSKYVYIHLNYPRTGASAELTGRIGDAGRFGYPVLVIYGADGNIRHIQDTGLLEDGASSYNRRHILRTLRLW